MNDIKKLQLAVQTFCEERDWDQFHTPKDLAIGLVTESSELLEIFRFKSNEEIERDFPVLRDEIEDEVADILFFLLRFAQMNNIDLENAFVKKNQKNTAKYPVEKAKGSNLKYNKLT